MESELTAQRDAAIAVAKELQRQQQTHHQQMERLFERRTLNAERLRLHAEEKCRRAVDDRNWSESCCHRLLTWTLFVGCGGAVVGWAVGLLLLLAVGEPLVGFLLVLPGMALGTLVGLAVARTARLGAAVREDGLPTGRRFAVYASTEVHSCHRKSVELLGLGASSLRQVPVRADWTMDVDALAAAP